MAEACVKAGVRKDPGAPTEYVDGTRHALTPYGQIYIDGRAKYVDAVHQHPCVRCGPSGSPAPAGSPLSDGHKHARALRLVAKAVLRDLWLEARRLHEEPS